MAGDKKEELNQNSKIDEEKKLEEELMERYFKLESVKKGTEEYLVLKEEIKKYLEEIIKLRGAFDNPKAVLKELAEKYLVYKIKKLNKGITKMPNDISVMEDLDNFEELSDGEEKKKNKGLDNPGKSCSEYDER